MTKTLESLPNLDQQPLDTIDIDLEREPITASQLRGEYQKLREQFRNRQLGITTLYGSHVYEDDVMATRFHGQQAVEEVWWASQDYNHRYKNGSAQTLSVQLYDDEGKYARLLVGNDDTLRLDLRESINGQTSWRRGSEAETQDTAFSIMHRASDARSIYQERDIQTREQADQHAKVLLGEKYPDLVAQEASLE